MKIQKGGSIDDLIANATKDGTRFACPFCDRAMPDLAISRSETGAFYAVFSKYPITKGHALIVPEKHLPDWLEMPEEMQIEGWQFAAGIARALATLDSSIEGVNIGVNVGEVAGQSIDHAHMHVIPRRKGDCEDPRGGIRNMLPGGRTPEAG